MAQHLGWRGFALVDLSFNLEEVASLNGGPASRFGVLARADCHESTRQAAGRWLRRLHPKVSIVGLDVMNSQMLGFGLKDRRFDVLNIDHFLGSRNLSMHTLKMLAGTEKTVEVNVQSLAEMEQVARSSAIADLKMLFHMKKRFDSSFRFSSGARNIRQQRSPHDLQALALVLGMSAQVASNMLFTPPNRNGASPQPSSSATSKLR